MERKEVKLSWNKTSEMVVDRRFGTNWPDLLSIRQKLFDEAAAAPAKESGTAVAPKEPKVSKIGRAAKAESSGDAAESWEDINIADEEDAGWDLIDSEEVKNNQGRSIQGWLGDLGQGFLDGVLDVMIGR